MPDARLTTAEALPSPIQQVPPADVIRRRLADLSRERTLLRQLLRIAVRREATDMAPTEEAADA